MVYIRYRKLYGRATDAGMEFHSTKILVARHLECYSISMRCDDSFLFQLSKRCVPRTSYIFITYTSDGRLLFTSNSLYRPMQSVMLSFDTSKSRHVQLSIHITADEKKIAHHRASIRLHKILKLFNFAATVSTFTSN